MCDSVRERLVVWLFMVNLLELNFANSKAIGLVFLTKAMGSPQEVI